MKHTHRAAVSLVSASVDYCKRALSSIYRVLPTPSASIAVFLLLVMVFQPLGIVLAEEDVSTVSSDIAEEISRNSVRKALQADKITKEEAKDIMENRQAVSITMEPDLQSTLFIKDESKSVQDELSLVRKHIQQNNLPGVALERLEAYEEDLLNSEEQDTGFVGKVRTVFKNRKLDVVQAKKHERLINEKPFEVETFKGEINIKDADGYESDYKGGLEKLRLLESVKQLIKNGKFLKRNTQDKTTGIMGGMFRTQSASASGDDPEEYLSEGGEIVFSQAIQDKANELGNDPLAMLNFVRNEISYSPYYGSKKGADATLVEIMGNDMDQSALLIALLRYSGVPARYRHVDMKISIGAVTNLLGVDDAIRAAEIMSLEDIPYTLYTLEGDPYFFVIDHTYVEAYMPYGYSRGADIDDQGASQWVPMEPTINSYFHSQRVDVVQEMKDDGFDIHAFYDDYLEGDYLTLEPMDAFRSEIEEYLAGAPFEYYPDLSYEEAFAKTHQSEKNFDFIPGSLPFEISATIGTYDYVPESYRHVVTFTMTNDGSNILSHAAYFSDLANQEVLISYDAATPDDQLILDTFDTIYDVVPLSLVEVTPKIKVRGDIVATAIASNTLGVSQDYELVFSAPERDLGGTVESTTVKTIQKGVISGVTEALAFNTDRVVPSIVRSSEDVESGSFAEEQKLYRTAVDYLYRLQTTHNELAKITGGSFTHIGTSASISNGVAVTYSDDLPFSFEWKGLRINAFATVRYFDRIGDTINHNREEFIAVFGLQASQDESDIFEDNFGVESVATVKGLKLVSAGTFPGITLEKIAEANEGDIDSLDVSEGTKDVFHDAINDGKIIYTPSAPITHGEWEGLFYIVIDFEGGDATYAIGEGLNGGYTVEQFPEGWENFWRDNLTIGLTATIYEPDNGDNFEMGDLIYWNASYESLLNDWDEEGYIDTDDLELGDVRLYSGYGTDDYVDIEIEDDPDTLIGTQYNQYDDFIVESEDEFGIPRGLLKSIIHRETANLPFEPNQYRYEPFRDYTIFSGPTPAYPLTSTHPYKRFAIAGHTTTGAVISEGEQLDDLNPPFTQVILSRGSGGWGLRSIKGYVEGQTYATLLVNDLASTPGTQGWPNVPNSNFTAQVVLSASYGMGHVLYESAMNIARDMSGDVWFDTSLTGTAREVFDMNEPEVAIRLAASVLRYKYDVMDDIASDAGKCDGWGYAVRTYNGSGPAAEAYRDDVCENYYEAKYKP